MQEISFNKTENFKNFQVEGGISTRSVEAQPLHFSPSVRKSTDNLIIAKTIAVLFEFIPRGGFWPCSLIPGAGQLAA